MSNLRSYVLFATVCAIFAGSRADGQGGGRFEEAKRMGMSYIQSEQFDKAAGRLEEVWEQDQSDPTVGEFLAVAYLNSEDRRMLPKVEKQAFAIIEKLVASGARVTFMVQHSHEKLGWLQGRELNQYCRGQLSIANHRLTYVSDKGEKKLRHSFDTAETAFKEISLNRDDRRGTLQLKLENGNYFIATRNRNRDEAALIVDLARQQLDSK
jgi:hypothetical protein